MSLEQLHIIQPEENLLPTPINDNSNKIMSWATSVDNDIEALKNFETIEETRTLIVNSRGDGHNYIYFYRLGHIVYANTMGTAFLSQNKGTTVANIPLGYRPVEALEYGWKPAINSNNNTGWYKTRISSDKTKLTIFVTPGSAQEFDYTESCFWYTEDPMPSD